MSAKKAIKDLHRVEIWADFLLSDGLAATGGPESESGRRKRRKKTFSCGGFSDLENIFTCLAGLAGSNIHSS